MSISKKIVNEFAALLDERILFERVEGSEPFTPREAQHLVEVAQEDYNNGARAGQFEGDWRNWRLLNKSDGVVLMECAPSQPVDKGLDNPAPVKYHVEECTEPTYTDWRRVQKGRSLAFCKGWIEGKIYQIEGVNSKFRVIELATNDVVYTAGWVKA